MDLISENLRLVEPLWIAGGAFFFGKDCINVPQRFRRDFWEQVIGVGICFCVMVCFLNCHEYLGGILGKR